MGVHIRRTDNALSIAQSPTRLFIERMKKEIEQNGDTTFYLASDSEEDKRSIVNRFGNRVFTSVHKADRNSLEGMQEALVELYLLSRTRHVLGSVHSSFPKRQLKSARYPTNCCATFAPINNSGHTREQNRFGKI